MGVERAMKTPNGTAWVLFKDETSLQKTLEIYHSGRSLLPPHFESRITTRPLIWQLAWPGALAVVRAREFAVERRAR
jgi:hypothetical protein